MMLTQVSTVLKCAWQTQHSLWNISGTIGKEADVGFMVGDGGGLKFHGKFRLDEDSEIF